MVIEFQQQKQDLVNHYRYLMAKRLKPSGRTVIWGLIISHCVGSINNHTGHFVLSRYILQFLLCITILYALIHLIPAVRFRLGSKKILNSYPDNVAMRIVTTVQGLSIEKNNETIAYNWENIRIVKQVDKNICIVIDGKFLLIPTNAFPSTNEVANFIGAINTRIPKTNTKKQLKAGSHLYKRGWLGLIPLVGFFVGLVLLIQAVFDYKNRKLAFIGLGGMLFSVIIYGSIFAFSNSMAGRRGFIEIAKSELNSLVQNIEYYRLKRGVYPDSLQQLKLEDSLVFLYDPMTNSETLFNYQKVGNKYTVFSSGLDRIPHTVDDIYPVIFVTDSSKIGFTRHLK